MREKPPTKELSRLSTITLTSGYSEVSIYQNTEGFTVLTSNLRDGEADTETEEESIRFAAMCEGIECVLLALFSTGALHAMAEDTRNEMFTEVCAALANHS